MFLVEKLPESTFNADILDVIAVVLNEVLELSVVILCEKLPESIFRADILAVIAVVLNDVLELSSVIR